MKFFNKDLNRFIIIAVILIIFGFGVLISLPIIGIDIRQNIDDISVKKPEGNSASVFLLNETGYSCSKEIPGEWREARVGVQGSKGYYFWPQNQGDIQKFCRTEYVIEYKAVIDILKREDIDKLIEKYDVSQAWVRALGHKYITDKDYLDRILPAYRNMKIDCIIVVHSPEGTRFFIENGEVHDSHDDHKYIEVEADKFLKSLNYASETDVTNFWLGLH